MGRSNSGSRSGKDVGQRIEVNFVPAQVGGDLSPEVQQRVEVIQELLCYQGSDCYGEVQAQAAQKLGISIRSVQRLLKKWREQGLLGLIGQPRKDRGQVRISSDWQEFIVKTYKEGNRGSRSLSPAQVALRVKARGQELGLEKWPSHMTVYRILNPLIEEKAKALPINKMSHRRRREASRRRQVSYFYE